ncbi:MAG: hypothetical protein ACRYFX_15320 [Janthinobacterium lividum]
MKTTYISRSFLQPTLTRPLGAAMAATDPDFITPDGQLVPRSQGEAALRQGTALLIGGILVGSWPE